MGFLQNAREQAEKQRAEQARAAEQSAAAREGCVGNHYETEVNGGFKGSINMRVWQGHLNARYAQGYRLAQVFEQDGNTVMVFEHHWH